MTEIDVKYLRDKGIAQLLESIAADLALQKPTDPELYLRERFALADASTQGVAPGDDLIVHSSNLDTSSAMVLIAAAYVRASVEYSEVDVETNKHLSVNYLAVSPFGKVPAIEHKGMVVTDGGAIVRYVCHGRPALPLASRDRARIDSAFEAVRTSLLPEVNAAAAEAVFAPRRNRRPVDRVALSAAVQRVRDVIATINETYFKDSVWVVSRSLTIADIALAACAFTMANVVGQDVCTDGPIKAWFDAVQREPCYSEALKGFAATAAQLRR